MYKQKYIKYKEKYIALKNQSGSGTNNNDICPICQEEFPPPPNGINQLTYMHLNTPEYRETTCCNKIYHTFFKFFHYIDNCFFVVLSKCFFSLLVILKCYILSYIVI